MLPASPECCPSLDLLKSAPLKPAPRSATSLSRLASGWAAGGIGFVVVLLGGWWFTLAVGVIVHLGLLEFFRMARFKGIRPATKTTLVAVQLLLLSTQAAAGSGWLTADVAGAVLPAGGAVICGWLLLQPVTGTIAEDGTVGAIGALLQKANAVKKSGAKIFLVPTAQGPDDIAAAQASVGDAVELVPVATLDEAIAALVERGGTPPI